MNKHPQGTNGMIESFWQVLARLLVMDCTTICAINGHAFGAGLFLALACDWRIMRTEKGFLNFPELNLGMPLSIGFAELAKAKLTPAVLRIGVLRGKRFNSSEALEAGLIDQVCSMEELQDSARNMAVDNLPSNMKLLNFNAKSLSQMKFELYTDAYRALTSGKVSGVQASKL